MKEAPRGAQRNRDWAVTRADQRTCLEIIEPGMPPPRVSAEDVRRSEKPMTSAIVALPELPSQTRGRWSAADGTT
ncbi:hypothetical protein ABLE91_00100 [Aquabacter sp. CN5-332]|uniref:hypothetical protein n=1 Tax=Aquabacter sp. CN5-332 TaxID=3156608 RepID=UPI0032B3ABEC